MGQLAPIRGSKYPFGITYESPRLDEKQLIARYGTHRKKLARVKHLLRNNFLCRSVVNAMKTHVCGNGIEPINASDPLRLAIWNGWSKLCDTTQTKNITMVLAEVVEAICAGDCLVYLRGSSKKADNRVSSFIEIVNSGRIDTPTDFIKNTSDNSGVNPANGNIIYCGVEYDSDNLEVGYWVIKDPCGSTTSANYVYLPRFNDVTGRFVSLLIRNPDTPPTSVRGMSVIDAVIPDVEDFASLCDSSIQSAIVKNQIAVGLESTAPESLASAVGAQEGMTATEDLATFGNIPFGSIFSVPSGSKIHTVSHSGNVDLVALLQHVKHNFSAGVGKPYEILFGDYAGVNFSAGKLLHDPFWRDVERWVYAIAFAVQAIYEAVTDEGLLVRGLVPANYSRSVSYWVGAPRTEADEGKAADSAMKKISGGLMPISIYHAKNGNSYAEILATYKANIDEEYNTLGFSPTEAMLKAAPQFKHLAPVATNVEVQDAPEEGEPSTPKPVKDENNSTE